MFLDEARLAAGVSHPNVCQVHELGEDEETGVVYMVMEWVQGDSLAKVLRPGETRSALEPTIAARIVADACAGLHTPRTRLADEDHGQAARHRP